MQLITALKQYCRLVNVNGDFTQTESCNSLQNIALVTRVNRHI